MKVAEVQIGLIWPHRLVKHNNMICQSEEVQKELSISFRCPTSMPKELLLMTSLNVTHFELILTKSYCHGLPSKQIHNMVITIGVVSKQILKGHFIKTLWVFHIMRMALSN